MQNPSLSPRFDPDFDPSVIATDRAALRDVPATTMSLLGYPTTGQCYAAIYALAYRIIRLKGNRKRPSAQYIAALGAAVADMLCSVSFDPPKACFRPMSTASFTGAYIGEQPFRRVLSDLTIAEFVRVEPGKAAFRGDPGVVTRIWPTVRLTDFMATHGVTTRDQMDHFGFVPLHEVTAPLRVRASCRYTLTYEKLTGRIMPVDYAHPRAARYAEDVRRINAFAARQTFSHTDEMVFFRGFNQGDDPAFDYNMGGRLYCVGGGYQGWSQYKKKATDPERSVILINEEPTIEVDISSSHIMIAHGTLGVPLPKRHDLYEIDGIPRVIVKQYVTALLGAGKVPERWASEHILEYDENDRRKLSRDYPIKAVEAKALKAIPVLNAVLEARMTWAHLQFAESEIIINAVSGLIKGKGIMTLPVHDSLILPESKSKVVTSCLTESFYNNSGIYPRVSTK